MSFIRAESFEQLRPILDALAGFQYHVSLPDYNGMVEYDMEHMESGMRLCFYKERAHLPKSPFGVKVIYPKSRHSSNSSAHSWGVLDYDKVEPSAKFTLGGRSAKAIAADIERRVVIPSLPLYWEALKRSQQDLSLAELQKKTLFECVALAGGVEKDAHQPQEGRAYIMKGGLRIEVRIAYDSRSMDLNLSHLSIEKAKEILGLL